MSGPPRHAKGATAYDPTAELPTVAAPVPAPAPGPTDDDAGDRGSLTIAARAVERIVARAAGEVDAVTGPPPPLGLGASQPARWTPRASAEVDGSVVAAKVEVSVRWPEPVREAAATVRQRVRERVGALTGLEVRQVDVTVAGLPVVVPRRSRVR